MLKPISQETYDEQRQVYGAETTEAPANFDKCPHNGFLKRMSAREVRCTKCNSGWFDEGKWQIREGSIA